MTNLDDIKARLDVVDLIGETVKLRRSGRSYTGFCPFHDNKKTPAFAVFPDSGTWRCFGQCNEGGDIFKFVMKKEGWDFPEALRYLAGRAGVELKPQSPQEISRTEENDRLRTLLEEAVTYFRHNLTQNPAGKPAYTYLQQRGLEPATIETWGLGYALQTWEAGIEHFRSRGYSQEDLLAAGLITARDGGGFYDRFRNRILFPIRDENGGMTGFGARVLNPDDQPKFLNSPQTALFDKGRLLYGLDQARRAIRTADQAVIVEGYLDVIALHQAGFANVVSPMGTALTEHQLRALKRRTRRIVLALDADAAGSTATLRGLQVARATMDRETEVSFDPRGLIRQETRLNADLRIVSLPDGKDPDEIVRADPQLWKKILEDANPIVTHVMESLAAGRNLDDPKVKSEIAGQILPLIADVGDPIERETYRQRLARLLRVDERALPGEAGPASRRPRSGGSSSADRSRAEGKPGRTGGRTLQTNLDSTRNLEVFALSGLMRQPDSLFRINRALQISGLARLNPQDFQEAAHQRLMSLIGEAIDQDYDEPIQFVLGSLPLSLMELVDGILAQTAGLDFPGHQILEELMRAVLQLRRKIVDRNISHLRFLLEDSQEAGEPADRVLMLSVHEHSRLLEKIDQAINRTNNRTILVG